MKGKLANGVGSQYSHTTSEGGVSSITNADSHTSAASNLLNYSPADLNGLVRLSERRNMVSARVPSGSARALQQNRLEAPGIIDKLLNRISVRKEHCTPLTDTCLKS